jgi:hypothetical protein
MNHFRHKIVFIFKSKLQLFLFAIFKLQLKLEERMLNHKILLAQLIFFMNFFFEKNLKIKLLFKILKLNFFYDFIKI